MPATDVGIITGFKGIGAALRGAQDKALAEQLALAKIAQSNQAAQLTSLLTKQKLMYPDIDNMGEQALYKAAQGLELTPQETAAAKVVNAKSGGIQFDPVTGAMLQKPTIASNLGLNFGQAPNTPKPSAFSPQPNVTQVTGDYIPEEGVNDYDIQFKKVFEAAAGNPKLQQQLIADYSKDKFNMNESQSKNATYADRLALAEPILTDPDKIKAYSSFGQKALDFINPFGAQLNSADYQSYKQAQLDAASARLRQESGAVIGESEYKYDREQLYPQVGDKPEVIEQKRRNREAIKRGLARGAGAGYVPPKITVPKAGAPINTPKNKTVSGSIPSSAAQRLRANPSEAAQFDEIFGKGASKRVLGR